MPQPSLSWQPVTCTKRCATSSGSGAPPEPQNFSDFKSWLLTPAWLMSAVNIVGTPGKMVTLFDEISFSAASRSKRACRINSAPSRRPSIMFTDSA
jgi:hypothetical protein